MLYTDRCLKEIVFPLGGIGTGSIGINGIGHLVDWEIFNRPNKGSYNGYTHLAIRAVFPDGTSDTRILQGDWTRDLMGQYGKERFRGYGFGPNVNTLAGLPHFRRVVFSDAFPFAALTFSDETFPAEIELTVFNPFLPHNVADSALPAALFEVTVRSRRPDVTYTVCFTLENPFDRSRNTEVGLGTGKAVFFRDMGHEPDSPDYGDLTLFCSSPDCAVQENWYRGGWVDAFCTYWRELTEGRLRPRRYPTDGSHDVSTLFLTEKPGQDGTFSCRFVLTWNVPVCRNYWSPALDGAGCERTWKNRYAVLFEDSRASARYVTAEYGRLRAGSEAFRDAMAACTLDPAIRTAVTSALCVLKSPTVLLLEDGTFYGWEGLHEQEGSCEGTCTHVWSYAYALCFLFPELERSLRECEFRYDVRDSGAMIFRTKLPLGTDPGGFRPCVDGQMASVFKTYREWRLSGDDKWLAERWETVKRILSFAWSEQNGDRWDADGDGILEGRQHHTLDMELFGPSSWLEGMYLAALRAAEEMGRRLGDPFADRCRTLFENGKRFLNDELFNGSWFAQRIDVRDRGPVERFGCPEYWNDEAGELKYQIGQGSEIDQMLGQWHADLLGLGEIFDRGKRRTALTHLFRHNFKPRLREVANTLRVFALNDESGTIICDYEGVEKPIIPIPYAEECMTGFEYAFAGQLMQEGLLEEGLTVVRAVRDRYDGEKRNPFNEIECGSNYARPMSCFALLPILSGFSFDLPNGTIGFDPLLPGPFTMLWNAADTWGLFIRSAGCDRITVLGKPLRLSRLRLGGIGRVRRAVIDGAETPFEQSDGAITWTEAAVTRDLLIERD